MRGMRWFALLAAVVVACTHTGAAAQDERILEFGSDITVRGDGSMLVTETIRVRAQGDQIRHGIYREFPTMYKGNWGLRKIVRFDVIGVTRAGRDEPFGIEPLENGVRVRIGDPEAMLPPGEHIYAITYETDQQIGFFGTHDELYWNVTGTGWLFPIDQISARVTLPSDVDPEAIHLEAYTGVRGSKNQDFTARIEDDGTIVFETTTPQPIGGNMTIVPQWPKGVVEQPTLSIAGLLRANFFILFGAIGVLIAGVYLHLRWIAVGRDPAKGLIAERRTPPEGFSPGACRYLLRMGHDQVAYAAALFNLAVTGVLSIHVSGDGSHSIEKLDPDAKPAFADEKAIAKTVLSKDERFKFEQENHAKVSRSIDAQSDALEKAHGELFAKNRGPLGIAFLILAVAWFAGLATLPLLYPGGGVFYMVMLGFLSVWIVAWSVVCLVIVLFAVAAWQKVARPDGKGSIGSAVFMSILSLPFLFAWGVSIVALASMGSFWMPVLLTLAAVLLVVYAKLLPAPTVEGRRLMDEIEGFRPYLRRGQDASTARSTGDGISEEDFERWLPYAVALDSSDEWSAYFEGVVDETLAQESRGDRQHWHPVWLHSTHGMIGAHALCDSIGSSLTSAVSSSSSAPGSSSGGGGGGFSGGGGGGGGGGGW